MDSHQQWSAIIESQASEKCSFLTEVAPRILVTGEIAMVRPTSNPPYIGVTAVTLVFLALSLAFVISA